jgi:hypothetical protein
MRVIQVPLRLKFALLLYVLTTVWVWLQVSLMLQYSSRWVLLDSPIAKLSVGLFAVFGHLLASLGIAAQIARGERWAYRMILVQAVLWHLAILILAWWLSSPSLAFTVLFASAYSLGTTAFLRSELRKPFFDPKMGWYQLKPIAIPGLFCAFDGEGSPSCQITAISREGFFCFSSDIAGDTLIDKKDLRFELQFREMKVSASGSLVRSGDLDSPRGRVSLFGIRLGGNSLDQQKDLGDFIEVLRSEGHVSS